MAQTYLQSIYLAIHGSVRYNIIYSGYHPILKKRVEMGNSGIFRP